MNGREVRKHGVQRTFPRQACRAVSQLQNKSEVTGYK